MLNMIKMELYRMLRTRSAYVILIVMALCVVLTDFLSLEEYKAMNEAVETAPVQMSADYSGPGGEEAATPNLGLTVTLPTAPGEKVTVFDLFFANVQGKFIALFMAIFAILFANADLSSGFVKNTAGQVRNRAGLVVAKSVAVSVYTLFILTVYLLVEAVCAKAIFGYLEWGSGKELLAYFAAQAVLHCAFMVILTAISVILRSSVISMMLAICLCMNVTIILYGAFNKVLEKLGFSDFDFISHTVTGKIAILPMDAGAADIRSALLIGAVFIVCSLAVAGAVFQKRDI